MVTFDSSQEALYIEEQIKKIINTRLIPIPEEISANCGVGLKITIEDFPLIKDKVLNYAIYIIEKENYKRTVKPWKIN